PPLSPPHIHPLSLHDALPISRMLWSIKTGKASESSDSPAARRGREMEQLARRAYEDRVRVQIEPICLVHERLRWMRASLDGLTLDRKSTRLNSSHVSISYAVF